MDNTKRPKRKMRLGLILVGVNLILIVFLAVFLHRYGRQYSENMRQQNLENLKNLALSSDELAEKFFETQTKELRNAVQYISKNSFTLQEALAYLDDSNADDISSYEILDKDYQGYYAQKKEDGTYETVYYGSKDYKEFKSSIKSLIEKEPDNVLFVPEFTDAHNAIKALGMAARVSLKNENGVEEDYCLISIEKSSDFSEMIQLDGGYAGLETAMIDEEGNYISSSANYKSDNFFRYIYLYNDLTLDEKNALIKEVQTQQEGELYFKNAESDLTVYVYQKMKRGDWYMVTGVPVASIGTSSREYTMTYVSILVLICLFVIDMLTMRTMNKKLKNSMQAEKKANEAKSDFLARMSHDIRTPLNAIIGFSILASDDSELSATTSDYLSKINSSGKYLLNLINDILDMSKIENNKFELHESLVNGVRFLEDIAAVFSAQADQKQITLKTDFSEAQTPWVYMDEVRTRQIYSNLLNNAIKFSDPGTTITWEIKDGIITDNQMHMICIISDQGCGMSEEFRQHLFKPFEQEQNAHSQKEGGTGLGLSIVKSLVELMGGTIDVESELGKGSTFTICLTRRLGEPKQGEKRADSNNLTKKLAGKRVLLCEDHPLNREISVKLLGKEGMLVECVENGEQGLQMFQESAEGYYQLILMDIRMPVMNGFEATKAIRALDRADASQIPIIAMTANAYEEDVKNCLEAGMNAHIAKPLDVDAMYKTIEMEL